MQFQSSILLSLCLLIGMIEANNICNSKRDFIMNTKIDAQNKGFYQVTDKSGNHVVLEWKVLNTTSPEFKGTMQSVADLATQSFTEVEMKFLKAHPEAINQERLYQSMV